MVTPWKVLKPRLALFLALYIHFTVSFLLVQLAFFHSPEVRHHLISRASEAQNFPDKKILPPRKQPQPKKPPNLPVSPRKKPSNSKNSTQSKNTPNPAARRPTPNSGKATTNLTSVGKLPHNPHLSVLTTSGRYLGFINQSEHPVDTWLGVRYAKPPIGELRFRAPVLLDSPPYDDGKANPAFKFGNACPQPEFDPPLGVGISEDCLYMNLYRPSSITPDSSLPVLVWIHGGGLTYGTAATVDGAVIVSSSIDLKRPIMFVSLNYRLNSFGFLNTDELPVEDLQVGLKDQIACLKWLKMNLPAFGGDPSKITIWGQSAGAFSVSLLSTYLFNSRSPNLFRAAIMDSGSPTTHTVPAVDVYDRRGMPYRLLLEETGCDAREIAVSNKRTHSKKKDGLECLRELDYETLLNATMAIGRTLPFARQVSVWGPSHKAGSLIPQRPSERLAEENFMKIPMIIGSNKDEGTLSAAGPSYGHDGSAKTSDEYFYSYMTNSSTLDYGAINPEVYAKVSELYPDDPRRGSPFDTASDTFGMPYIFKRLAAWFGDLHYQAPRRLWAKTASPHQPVYVYYFDGPAPSNVDSFAGVAHSSELPLIFGNSNVEDLPSPEIKATYELARKIRNRYISFVYELNPGDDWPAYKTNEKKVMRFNKEILHGELIYDDWRAEQLDYLTSQPALDTYMT